MRLVVLLLSALLSATPASGAQMLTDAEALALTLIHDQRMSEDLTVRASRAIYATDTFRALAARVGGKPAADLVTAELIVLLPVYLPQWELHMATALAGLLPMDVLESLVRDGPVSTYANRLDDIKRDVVLEMHERGELIVQGYAVGALLKAYEKALQNVSRAQTSN